MLHLEPLARASGALRSALVRCAQAPHDDLLRDGCIQRFERSYELAWKMSKRQLEVSAADPVAVDRLSFRDLIRAGGEAGLVRGELTKWLGFRTARGTTSHVHDARKAALVLTAIPAFLAEAEDLLARLVAAQARGNPGQAG